MHNMMIRMKQNKPEKMPIFDNPDRSEGNSVSLFWDSLNICRFASLKSPEGTLSSWLSDTVHSHNMEQDNKLKIREVATKHVRTCRVGARLSIDSGIDLSLFSPKLSCSTRDRQPRVFGKDSSLFHLAEHTVRFESDENNSSGIVVIPVLSRERNSNCLHAETHRMSFKGLFDTVIEKNKAFERK